ncbi:MAG TPA: PAS domain S-box protein, partial [Candidatus Lokiarchaeia archaeon]
MSNSKINSKRDYEKIAKEMEIILDHIPGLVFFKDTKNKFIRVNKYLAEAHKMTKEEMIGKSCFDLYPKDQAQAYWEDDMEVIKSGSPKLNIEELWETEKGKSWVSTNKVPYFDENGEIIGIIGFSIDISEHKKAEKINKTIIQSALDGFWVTDMKGRFLDVNDSYCQMIGYTSEELLKMSISDIEASERPDETDQHMRKVMNQGYDRFETQHRHKDGHIIEIEVSVNYLDIEEGRLFVFLRDISERKKDQQKLKQSQEQMNSIFLNLKDTVFVISDNYEILFKNEPAHSIFGKDLVGRKCYDVIKALDQPCDRCPMITIVETNVCQVRFEQCVSFSDTKETKFFDIIMTPIENYGGQHAFIELLRDSTENRKLRDKLKESEEKYRGLYDSIKDGIIMTDMEGKILETNQAY